MSINFNSLPTEKPAQGTVIPTGQYIGTIKKAEMKQPKDEKRPPYLNLEIDIVDEASATEMGKLWAVLSESEHPLPRYQLSRFIQALNLPITGEFELKDLTKMVVGKQLKLDVTPEDRNDGKEPQKSVVDVSAEIFYPLNTTANTTDDIDFPDPMPANTTQEQPAAMSSY